LCLGNAENRNAAEATVIFQLHWTRFISQYNLIFISYNNLTLSYNFIRTVRRALARKLILLSFNLFQANFDKILF